MRLPKPSRPAPAGILYLVPRPRADLEVAAGSGGTVIAPAVDDERHLA